MLPEPLAITLLVIDAFEQLNVPYLIGGEVSDRQWRDILGVLKMQTGRLDLDYMQKWATELQVSDLLEKALRESK